MRYAVTLVHGTWARNASWTRPDSAISRALTERFGNEVCVQAFRWSGRNTHTARVRAAEGLRAYLESRIKQCASARHFLICHSHGGNVALYALRDPALMGKVSGVACLATPFIVARERRLGQSQAWHIGGGMVALMFLLLCAMGHSNAFSGILGPYAGVARFLVPVMFLIGFMLLVRVWKNFSDRLLAELTLPSVPSNKLLIVRAPGDEASSALSFFQFVSQLSVRVYTTLVDAHMRVEGAARGWAGRKWRLAGIAVLSFLGCVALILLVASQGLMWTEEPRTLREFAVMGAVLVPLLVSVGAALLFFGTPDIIALPIKVAVSFVLWPLVLVLSVLHLPFGWQVALGSVLLDVTAETCPPGTWTLHQLDPPGADGAGGRAPPLMHSVVYEHPDAVHLTCDWIGSVHD